MVVYGVLAFAVTKTEQTKQLKLIRKAVSGRHNKFLHRIWQVNRKWIRQPTDQADTFVNAGAASCWLHTWFSVIRFLGSRCFYEAERSEDSAPAEHVMNGRLRLWACQARRSSNVELWDSQGESRIVALSGRLLRSNMLTVALLPRGILGWRTLGADIWKGRHF